MRAKRLWQGPASAKPINIPDSLMQGPLASLATFGTRQEGIRRVVAGMERWREERAVEGKEKGRRLEVKK